MDFYNTGGSGLPPSPIGNVGIQQQMQQQQQIPFTPVGGYYTNYNGYFNPWEIQKRQDEFLKAQADAQKLQIDINKHIIMNANKTLGIDISQDEVDKMFENAMPKVQTSYELFKEQEAQKEQQMLYSAVTSPNANYGSIMAAAYTKIFADAEKERMDMYEGKTLEEQYQVLTEMAFDQREEEIRKENRNFKGTYKSNDYRSLISNTTDPSRTIFNNIDDMEITLPNGSPISSEYQQKRAMFLNKLLGR